jgi:hypothetical protein
MTGVLASAPGRLEVDELLEHHGLGGAAAAVAFFSFASPESFIAARYPDGTLAPLIGFFPLPVHGTELLDAIAATDEHSPRLIANFERTFREPSEGIRAFGSEYEGVETESLGWLLAACGLMLGMQEQDVAAALGTVGELVSVDTVVVDHGGRYVLDSRRLLRSVMSYRIAGVPRHVVARSVFESLGDYAANAVRRLLRDWKVDVVVCAGDLFARNQFIAERTRRGLVRPNLRVLFPESG